MNVNNVVFNGKKSKCLYITSRVKRSRLLSAPPQFTIGGNVIEFVDKWPHLGHIISAVHMGGATGGCGVDNVPPPTFETSGVQAVQRGGPMKMIYASTADILYSVLYK